MTVEIPSQRLSPDRRTVALDDAGALPALLLVAAAVGWDLLLVRRLDGDRLQAVLGRQ